MMQHKWCLHRGGGNGKRLYAQSNIKINGQWKRVLMHRFILGWPPHQKVDHEDNNGLNNTRENLRPATREQNKHNSGRRIYKGTRSSRFKGVCWSKAMKSWLAQITKDRQHHHLGCFENEEDAARAYDEAAKRLHGCFARTNF